MIQNTSKNQYLYAHYGRITYSSLLWDTLYYIGQIYGGTFAENHQNRLKKIAVTSTMYFSNQYDIKFSRGNQQKNFSISFEDTATFSYLPN